MKHGINFSGHLNSNSSIGIASRDNILALKPHCDMAFNELKLGQDDNAHYGQKLLSADNPHPINFMHFNPDQFGRFHSERKQGYFEGKKNIGFWVWECSKILDNWKKAATNYDEIWTASEYCANIFQRELSIKTRVLPHMIKEPPIGYEGINRNDFGIPKDKFVYYTAFDAWSRLERKNPRAIIDAFRAVHEHVPESFLVIKVRHLDAMDRARLFDSIDMSNIMLVEKYLTDQELWGLANCCNCFVSLHKSEGFGLHIAEAMRLAKPIVTTGYSGNMQFCRSDHTYLVDFEIEDAMDSYYRPTGGKWANPYVESAADQMLRVFRDQVRAIDRGLQGMHFIRRVHTQQAISKLALKHLTDIENGN